MSVGVRAIDADHQQMIMLVNQVEDLARRFPKLDGGSEAAVRTLLARLQKYAREHFAREENIQRQSDYPGLAENKLDHDRLTRELAEIVERYQAGPGTKDPLTAEQLVDFLKGWLVNHIIKVDLKMKGFAFNQSAAVW